MGGTTPSSACVRWASARLAQIDPAHELLKETLGLGNEPVSKSTVRAPEAPLEVKVEPIQTMPIRAQWPELSVVEERRSEVVKAEPMSAPCQNECPAISPSIRGDARWSRRPLWQYFYPRLRHIRDPMTAATTASILLRERVTISSIVRGPSDINNAWISGIASPESFQMLHLAVLCSVGIIARQTDRETTEILTASGWISMPDIPDWKLKWPELKTDTE